MDDGALGGEDGRIRSRLDEEGDSLSDVGYQLNGWGSGRDYVTVRSRIRGTIKSRCRWWTMARFWYLQNRNFLDINVVLDEWVVRA